MSKLTMSAEPASAGATATGPLIRATGLTKKFGENVVLHGIDVSIEAGEFVTVMGPSGSGKSTLLYALSGMDRPTSGTVTFDGHELTDSDERELARLRLTRMGFVFQQIHLLKNLGLLDNILLPAFMVPGADRAILAERGRALMQRVGIGELADRTVAQASGGQLQRVGICRALINEPPVVFGDEPTGALDSAAAAEILDLLESINRDGTTLVVVTHDVRVAARADRVLLLSDGRIIGDRRQGPATPAALETRHAELTTWLLEHGF